MFKKHFTPSMVMGVGIVATGVAGALSPLALFPGVLITLYVSCVARSYQLRGTPQ